MSDNDHCRVVIKVSVVLTMTDSCEGIKLPCNIQIQHAQPYSSHFARCVTLRLYTVNRFIFGDFRILHSSLMSVVKTYFTGLNVFCSINSIEVKNTQIDTGPIY